MGESKRGKVRLSALKRLMVCAIIFSLVFPGIFTTDIGFADVLASANNNTKNNDLASSRVIEIDESELPNESRVISQTSWQLAPGITETEIVTNVSSGNRQAMEYACTVNREFDS